MRIERQALAVLLLVLACTRCGSHASAQSDELLVARIGLSEGPSDTLAIAHVLAERSVARGITVREAACSYAPRSCGRREYTARPWVPRAHPDSFAPLGWPWLSSWERTRTLLASLTVVAWRGLRGIDESPCAGATEWGAPTCAACRRRMQAAGYERVDCPGANHFWAERLAPATPPPMCIGGAS